MTNRKLAPYLSFSRTQPCRSKNDIVEPFSPFFSITHITKVESKRWRRLAVDKTKKTMQKSRQFDAFWPTYIALMLGKWWEHFQAGKRISPWISNQYQALRNLYFSSLLPLARQRQRRKNERRTSCRCWPALRCALVNRRCQGRESSAAFSITCDSFWLNSPDISQTEALKFERFTMVVS